MALGLGLGTVLAGAASGIGSIVGSIFGKSSQDKTNAANMELAKYQYEMNKQENELAYKRQKEFWNLQNQYNSPAQQMARLKSAGLNPNLVYGNGAVGNTSGGYPSYNPTKYEAPTMRAYTGYNIGLGEAMQAAMSYRMNDAVINKTQADAAKVAAETANTIASKRGITASGYLREMELKKAQALFDNSIETANATLENIKANTASTNIRTDLARADLAMRPRELEKLESEIIGIKNENDLKAFELTLQTKYGLSRNSPEWMKVMAIILKSIMPNLNFESLGQMFNPR